ncbi:MAG: SH3 domain-containing protein [Thermomicrobiales bacterium]
MEGTHGNETGFGLVRTGGMVSRRETAKPATARPFYRLVTAITLVALLVAGFAALPEAPRALAADDYTTDSVNFRTGPGTDYDVMTIIPSGAPITVLGGPENGFYYIQYGDATGYASGDFLSVGGSAPEPSAPVEMPVSNDGATGAAWVIDGTLNLRTEPGPSGTVILVMPDAAQVELTGEQANGYAGVIYSGTVGWASLDYLSQSAPSAPETPAPTDPVTPEPTAAPSEPTSPGGPYTEDEIIQIIYDAADRYGQPREDMLRVATCESGLDPSAVNASSGASGLFQFMPSTFASTPYADQDIFDAWASANAAGWMWSVGRRNEWECQ